MAAQNVEQATVALRAELGATKAQLAAEQHERQVLEHNTAKAFQAQILKVQELERQIAQMKATGGKGDRMDLWNTKNVKPEVFTSKTGEPWKPWATRIKLFLRAKAAGFRAALVAVEKLQMEIPPGDLSFTDWAVRDDADGQLHDFLLNQTEGRAKQIVEEPRLEGRGFETWRRLKEEFEPR